MPWKAPFVGTRGAFSVRTPLLKQCQMMLTQQYKKKPIEQAVNVDLFFFMKIPKATSKKKKALMISGEIRPEGTPDRDRLGLVTSARSACRGRDPPDPHLRLVRDAEAGAGTARSARPRPDRRRGAWREDRRDR